MKKIISAILALTILLSLCACNGDVEGTETSDVSSTPIISIDPSSMLSSDSPSSDIPSNEGSKPDEVLSSTADSSQDSTSSEPETPLTPEEEEEEKKIQKALNNPGASLDYDVFLVDAPEEGNEWKLLRYNMEEEELYEEFSFSPKNATGSYTVEFTDEYVGNILKVTFEDGMSCYIDVEKNKFYNSSEFKGLSKTLSVTKRNIAVTKNGQYEVWTTSHPDYGKVYYSELNEDENLLLTVFLKNNKYTFTSYNYETKEFKNLFTISEKPEVKLLQDGWFIFELEPSSTTATDGGLYMCDVDKGVRLPLDAKEGWEYDKDGKFSSSFTFDTSMYDDFIERAREDRIATSGNYLWWYSDGGYSTGFIYRLQLTDSARICRKRTPNTADPENNRFFHIGSALALKLNKINFDTTDVNGEKRGTLLICNDTNTIGSYTGHWGETMYMTPDGNRLFYHNGEAWENSPLNVKVDGEVSMNNKMLLDAPGFYHEGNVWFIRPSYVKAEGKYYSYLYRYDTKLQKIYLVKKYSMSEGYSVDRYDGYILYFDELYGKEYIVIESGYAIDPHIWLIDFNTLEPTLEYRLTWYSEEKAMVRTDREDLIYSDTYMEVWKSHPEYGIVKTATFVPNTSLAVWIFDNEWDAPDIPCRAMLYDYSTGKLTEILCHDVSADIIFSEAYDERYVFIYTTPNESLDTFYYINTAYIYDVKTGVLTKLRDGSLKQPIRVNSFCGNNDGVIFSDIVYKEEPSGDWDYDENYYFYNFATKKITKLLEIEGINCSNEYTERGVFVKTYTDGNYYSPTGALYHTTLTKSTLISESVSTYYVCEDQDYVMYYEEQEDGSFEWKYYNF